MSTKAVGDTSFIDHGCNSTSNTMSCDIINNELTDSPSNLKDIDIHPKEESNRRESKKDFYHLVKSPGEDDEDSGVDLGPFLFSSVGHDDNAIKGKLGIF